MERECCIGRGRTKLNSRGIQAERVRRGLHGAGRVGTSKRSREAARRTAPGERADKSFESREGE